MYPVFNQHRLETNMAPNKSKIVDWYKGRNIFITGGTGFMGKVLVEKLLFTCKDIGNLYILMRSKRGRTPEQRVEDMWKLPVFQRLHETDPDTKKKIIPVCGDLVTDNLGLSEKDLNIIINDVSVVFHCAATLKLEATLKDAVEQNTAGTKRVVDVSKKIKNLAIFLHMSTAFCSADLDKFEERVYPCENNPRDVIDAAGWMREDALKIATPSIIAPHPNTYTYSKRLAETLVAQEAENMRVVIVRPSIVTPSTTEPIPGWVDTLNGPMGLLVAAGKGVLRSMHCKGDYKAQVVPVDIAINAMVVIAYKHGSAEEKPEEVPVYNFTNDAVFHITWSDILNVGRNVMKEYPFEQMIWYPDGDMRSSYIVHQIMCIFLHWLPAYFIDFLLFVFRQKRFMVRVQNKIHDGLELLQFFTTREWDFASEKFIALTGELDAVDKELFKMDFLVYPMDEYMKIATLGTRLYTMREDPKTIGRCRIQLKVLYVLDKAFSLALYLGLIWLICSCSETAKELFDFVGFYAKNIPVLGALIPTN